MARKNTSLIIGINDLIKEISSHSSIIFSDNDWSFIENYTNQEKLQLLICPEYWHTSKGTFLLNIFSDNTVLSNLLTGKDGHTSIKGNRNNLAQDLSGVNKKYFEQSQALFLDTFNNLSFHSQIKLSDALPAVYKTLTSPVIAVTRLDSNYNYPCENVNEYIFQLDTFHKALLNMFQNQYYSQFFWWLSLYCLMQKEIIFFFSFIADTQYASIVSYLNENSHDKKIFFDHSPVLYINKQDFWSLRRELINTTKGELIIAGASLRNVFNISRPNSIVNELSQAISSGRLKKLSLLISDTELFDSSLNYGDPIRDVSETIESLENRFYPLFEEKRIPLNIYFLPFLQIDHAVITEELMLFRSNKLWNKDRKYKGAFYLYIADYYTSQLSEYAPHKEYLQAIMEHSSKVDLSMDIDERALIESSARGRQMRWRNTLKKKHYKYITFYKTYEKQLFSYVCNSWNDSNLRVGQIYYRQDSDIISDFFDPSILINDTTQQVLLPYLRETQNLFTTAIKKYDKTSDAFCRIIPSLDLGFPNNVQRLAGGFATGMLVIWQCGINIVPIDATVNTCTSSVFRLDNFDPSVLKNKNVFLSLLKNIFNTASFEKGYSFSFQSGNHFLIIAQDKLSKEYYLVLHSSANELKNSYMGLYPVENNWYADKIKTITGNNGRYFRYLKGDDAKYFITMAMNFTKYNEQIHQWLAEQINGDKLDKKDICMKHHYYMPTKQSIALGTFAERPGTIVPIFSAPGKPIYLFRISEDNWTIDLGSSKDKVCLIPHGWGQKIDNIQSIQTDGLNLKLTIGGEEYITPVNSSSRIQCPEKMLRDFKDGYDFMNTSSDYMKGEIVKELVPLFEYSAHNN